MSYEFVYFFFLLVFFSRSAEEVTNRIIEYIDCHVYNIVIITL